MRAASATTGRRRCWRYRGPNLGRSLSGCCNTGFPHPIGRRTGRSCECLKYSGWSYLLECALAMTLPGRRSYGATVSHRAHRRAEHCRRRRGGWALLTFWLLLCLFVATYSLWDSEGSARTIAIATVDRPTSAKPPQPPSPARTQAVAELRTELQGISRSHAGTYGMIVFEPHSGQTVSLNADRRFVAASLSKLYALLLSSFNLAPLTSCIVSTMPPREMSGEFSQENYRLYVPGPMPRC